MKRYLAFRNLSHQPEVYVVRVARTTVLESGCEYVVPGTARLPHAADGDMMLSPTKGFNEKHHVLVAYVIIQMQQSTNTNPGLTPVTLKRGAVARVLQPAKVLGKVELQSPRAPAVPEPINPVSAPVPRHLQALYAKSCACLPEDDCGRLAHLLQSHSDVFSTGTTDLGRTSLVQHDILTTPGPPVKQPPHRMARDKQTAAGAAEPGGRRLACPNPATAAGLHRS